MANILQMVILNGSYLNDSVGNSNKNSYELFLGIFGNKFTLVQVTTA